MGKSCVRFKKLGDFPFDLIREAIRRTRIRSQKPKHHPGR